MGFIDVFDNHWTSALGALLVVLGLVPVTEALFQINIVGGTLPFKQGWVMGLFTIGVGVLLATRGATKAADYIKEIIWGWRLAN
ncbi:hypothetical protein [Haloferax volcanii]|uniref:Uncharacterized protein n=1 Tax=Haloferax volcanii TaxID=2246 RepID=A0A8T5C5K1_HALVO|nr:hypothetical protein [Haloferax volcanii]MBS8120605.1 hypothetical protein [Haloferax volcanii]MBS8125642.1 hypothetical protein [Haloferax volcanii]MBS8129651.1 hypothetical protein [Haloferax volcanii]MBS8133516.1 hypothetical protein [Haloferax volcanii]MDW7538389.1 hypothetical protein [Haloferax volcanii]